jgi:hypothetical protein
VAASPRQGTSPPPAAAPSTAGDRPARERAERRRPERKARISVRSARRSSDSGLGELLSDIKGTVVEGDGGPVMLAAAALLMLVLASGSFLSLMTRLSRERRP